MMNFFKDSIREFKHVVWPTSTETRKYLLFVLSVLIVFGIYLFIANYLFSEGIMYLRNIIKN